ncbi:MAG: alpha/beta hydrolase family protein [Halanaerobiaceae bacterium]
MNKKLQADRYVHTLAEEQERKYKFKIRNQGEIKSWQQQFRKELINILGINEIKKRCGEDLEPVCLDRVELDDHIREEWEITSEPGYQVPFYLLKPIDQKKALPLVLTPHGHGKAGKDTYAGIAHNQKQKEKIKEGERDIALQAVREGYIAIAPDVRGFAGTRLKKDIEEDNISSCRTMQMHALLFGRTLIGERVWDIIRLIDFAKTQDEINTDKIMITGNSGGGTNSLFAGAVDTRIDVVIPSCYFCTFEDSIGSIYHCECNYIPGIMKLGEMYEVAGLIAPRPFLAVAGKEDPIFPLKGVKKAFKKLKKIYEVAQVSQKCELYIGEGGHRYYKERVWPFVNKWFEMEN